MKYDTSLQRYKVSYDKRMRKNKKQNHKQKMRWCMFKTITIKIINKYIQTYM